MMYVTVKEVFCYDEVYYQSIYKTITIHSSTFNDSSVEKVRKMKSVVRHYTSAQCGTTLQCSAALRFSAVRHCTFHT